MPACCHVWKTRRGHEIRILDSKWRPSRTTPTPSVRHLNLTSSDWRPAGPPAQRSVVSLTARHAHATSHTHTAACAHATKRAASMQRSLLRVRRHPQVPGTRMSLWTPTRLYVLSPVGARATRPITRVRAPRCPLSMQRPQNACNQLHTTRPLYRSIHVPRCLRSTNVPRMEWSASHPESIHVPTGGPLPAHLL